MSSLSEKKFNPPGGPVIHKKKKKPQQTEEEKIIKWLQKGNQTTDKSTQPPKDHLYFQFYGRKIKY